jgi:hypothetical protein
MLSKTTAAINQQSWFLISVEVAVGKSKMILLCLNPFDAKFRKGK